MDTNDPTAYGFQYDADGRVLSGTLQDAVTGTLSNRYVYSYSQADNRTSEQINDSS